MAQVIGIDPGKTGAIVLVRGMRAGDERIEAWWDMPTETLRVNGKERARVSARAVCTIFDGLTLPLERPSVCIEHVHGYGRDGSVGAFSFGRAFGIVETAAHSCGLNVHLVAPAIWKRALGLSSLKDTSRFVAKQVFPDSAHLFARVKDDGRAEAALLAYYWLQKQYNRPMVQW